MKNGGNDSINDGSMGAQQLATQSQNGLQRLKQQDTLQYALWWSCCCFQVRDVKMTSNAGWNAWQSVQAFVF